MAELAPGASRTSVNRRATFLVAAGALTIILALVAFLTPGISNDVTTNTVGWLLIVAGLVEIGAGTSAAGRITFVLTGALTLTAGLLALAKGVPAIHGVSGGNGTISIFPIIATWLATRGLVLIGGAIVQDSQRLQMAVLGLANIILSLAILTKMQAVVLVKIMFGYTSGMITFLLIIVSLSLLLTGAFLIHAGRSLRIR